MLSRETKEVELDDEKPIAPVATRSQAHEVRTAGSPRSSAVPDSIVNCLRQITEFLAQRALPDFRRFLIDNDKTVAVCSNMVYYIVAPSFKTRARSVPPLL